MFKIFEKITEVIGWLQIVISPTLLGFSIGCVIYYTIQNLTGLICGVIVSIIGFLFGIVLATKKFKTIGTVQFLSRVIATPELDRKDKTKDQEKTYHP